MSISLTQARTKDNKADVGNFMELQTACRNPGYFNPARPINMLSSWENYYHILPYFYWEAPGTLYLMESERMEYNVTGLDSAYDGIGVIEEEVKTSGNEVYLFNSGSSVKAAIYCSIWYDFSGGYFTCYIERSIDGERTGQCTAVQN